MNGATYSYWLERDRQRITDAELRRVVAERDARQHQAEPAPAQEPAPCRRLCCTQGARLAAQERVRQEGQR